ncbi:MAG: hypothetical protein ACRDNZ_04240 [Streptosporangiaceae bacterium]
MLLSLSLAAAAATPPSFADKVVLWLHIGFAIFTIGPVTAALMATPRYIRAGDATVVRYLYRTTRLFTVISLAVLLLGVVLAQRLHDFAKPWLTVSMTLFVVAIVLLLIVLRDQRAALRALAGAQPVHAPSAAAVAPAPARDATAIVVAQASGDGPTAATDDLLTASQPDHTELAGAVAAHTDDATIPRVAIVERGRIATLGAVITVDWLVILALMVWR